MKKSAQEIVRRTRGRDTGTGNTLDNVITGNAAGNTLTALKGNDTLKNGIANDEMWRKAA